MRKENTRKLDTIRKGHSYYNTKRNREIRMIKKCLVKLFIKLMLFIMIVILLHNILHKDNKTVECSSEINKEELQEMITEIVNEELMKQEMNKPVEEKQEIQEEQKSEIESLAKVEVTSRGSSIAREDISKTNKLTGYKVTSYYPGDKCASTNKTGSGKSINDFSTMKIGNKNVYTYKGKIVVAAWSKELYNTGYNVKNAQSCKDYKFHYNQEIKLIINGTTYNAIVLDSCGAAGWNDRGPIIDIFVPSASDCINSSNVQVII